MLKMNAYKKENNVNNYILNFLIIFLLSLYIYQITYFSKINKQSSNFKTKIKNNRIENNKEFKYSDIVSLKDMLENKKAFDISIDKIGTKIIISGKIVNYSDILDILNNNKTLLLKSMEFKNDKYYFSIRII